MGMHFFLDMFFVAPNLWESSRGNSSPLSKGDTWGRASSDERASAMVEISIHLTRGVHAKGVVLCERACFCLLSAF